MRGTMPVYKSIVAFMALACLIAATGVGGTVLCIGADGNATIEYATGGTCTSYACERTERLSTSSAIRPTVPANGHYGSCIDIPLGAGEATKQPVLPTSPSPSLYLAPDCQSDMVGSWTACAAGTTSQFCPAANTTLALLRTVVLLT